MKQQTATEFLVTYGWAILVIAIIMLAIFATGVFNTSNYAAQQCVISSGFSCLSLFAGTDGTILVNIQQATSAPINITAIGCNQNSMVTGINMLTFNTIKSQIFLPVGGNFTTVLQCYNNQGTAYSGATGSVFSGHIVINYTNDLTHIPEIAVGSVATKLSSPSLLYACTSTITSVSTTSTAASSTTTVIGASTTTSTTVTTTSSTTVTTTTISQVTLVQSACSGNEMDLPAPPVSESNSLSFTSAVTINNMLVVAAGGGTWRGGAITSPPTDTQGDSWTNLEAASGSCAMCASDIWYATAKSTSAEKVTVNFGTLNRTGMCIYELAGALTPTGALSTSGSSNSAAVSPLTYNAGAFMLGAIGSWESGSPTGPTSGFTSDLLPPSGYYYIFEHEIIASAGTSTFPIVWSYYPSPLAMEYAESAAVFNPAPSTTTTIPQDIYCTGTLGTSPYTYTYYAPISTGSVGAWTSSTSYPVTEDGAGCSISPNGYIYCVGSASGLMNQVYYAQISTSGIGAWTSTTNYPTSLNTAGCSLYNGYLYCVGNGYPGYNALGLTYYAPVSTTGVGTWSSTSTYPIGFWGDGCSINSGYIYCVGTEEMENPRSTWFITRQCLQQA